MGRGPLCVAFFSNRYDTFYACSPWIASFILHFRQPKFKRYNYFLFLINTSCTYILCDVVTIFTYRQVITSNFQEDLPIYYKIFSRSNLVWKREEPSRYLFLPCDRSFCVYGETRVTKFALKIRVYTRAYRSYKISITLYARTLRAERTFHWERKGSNCRLKKIIIPVSLNLNSFIRWIQIKTHASSCILTATFGRTSVWIILCILYSVARMYVDACLFLTGCNLVRKLRTERCRIILYLKKHEKWFTCWTKSEIEMWQSEDRIGGIRMWRLLSGHDDAYSLTVIRDEKINICKRRALWRNVDTRGIYLPRFIWSPRYGWHREGSSNLIFFSQF